MESPHTYRVSGIKNLRDLAVWYAVCTRPHHEKEVFRKLGEQNINAYLPLVTTLRTWSDRKKKVTLPLFNGYLFVYIATRDYYSVLNTPGVIRYVTFGGKAVSVPEKQIRMVKDMLAQDLELEEVKDQLYTGAKVTIVAGALKGITGELIDFSGRQRVIIRMDEIRKSMVISVPMHLLRLIE